MPNSPASLSNGWNRFKRAALTSLACGIVYFITLEVFLGIPAFNETTQVRPASGLSPVLGLLFGLPGALGCTIGNLISDSFYESNAIMLLQYSIVQLIYSLGLRGIWKLFFRGPAQPTLSSAKHIGVFILGSFIDSALVTLLLIPFELDSMVALNIHVVRLLNNYLSLIYVGIPVMLIVDRFHRKGSKRPLPEKFSLIALGVAALTSILCLAIMLSLEMATKTFSLHDLDNLIAVIYLLLSAISTCLFVLAYIMLNTLDRSLATPLNILAIDASTLTERIAGEGPENLRDGKLDVVIPGDNVLDEISLVVSETNKMRHSLGSSMIDSQNMARERERVSTELDLAARIQAASLPTEFSALGAQYALSIDAFMQPAREVGGDFYDVFALDDSRLCILVADVSDKGVPAALFMMRAMAEARDCLRSSSSLSEGLTHTSAHLCSNNDSMLFVTMFAIALDSVTGEIEFANAGHNLPVLISPVRGNTWLKAKPGLPLGVLEDFEYASGHSRLFPGEQIVLYTDGVTEARSKSGELFGDARLFACLEAPNDGAVSAVETIKRSAASFSSGAEQADDLTLVSFEWLAGCKAQTFAADKNLCLAACQFVRNSLNDAIVAEHGFAIDLIVEELFTNVAKHAYAANDKVEDGVTILVSEDSFARTIHLVFLDSGIGYNPLEHRTASVDPSASLDELQPGGMGILLVKKLSDFMAYERVDNKNMLHIVKRYGI